MRLLFFLLITSLLSGCEFWFDNFTKQGEASVYLSTVPRAELSEVTLAISQIEMQHSAGQWHTLAVKNNSSSKNLQQIPPNNPLLIAQQDKLPAGEYKRLRISFDASSGKVIARDNGGFFNVDTVGTLSVDIASGFNLKRDQQADLLLTLDLQHALVKYESDNNWFYRLEAQALRAVPLNAAYIYGHIQQAAWQSLECDTAEFTDTDELVNSYVYLYKDNDQERDELLDLQLTNTQAPIATAAVMANGSDTSKQQYRFSAIPEGRYILALTCHGERDHPSVHNSDVVISKGNRVNFGGSSNQRVNFN